MLLHFGYLKSTGTRDIGAKTYHTLEIPNLEVRSFYEDVALHRLVEHKAEHAILMLLDAMLENRLSQFEKRVEPLLRPLLGSRDPSREPAETIHHALYLGFLAQLAGSFTLSSREEPTQGRYSLFSAPKDGKGQGYILEVQEIDQDDDPEDLAIETVEELVEGRHVGEMWKRGVDSVLAIGLAVNEEHIAAACQKVTR